jgi:hypothetical protein
MILALNPLLEGLEVARQAGSDAVHEEDEITVEDRGDHWVFEFIPRDDALGGGARISIAKDGLRVLKIVRGQ